MFIREYSVSDCFADKSTEESDVERNSSDSEISSCSPRQLQDPEEPQYIYISSGEESIVEEENIHQQGTCNVRRQCNNYISEQYCRNNLQVSLVPRHSRREEGAPGTHCLCMLLIS